MLCGCEATLNQSLVERAPAPLAVDLKALDPCRRLLAHGPLPDIKPTDDARAAFERDDAALIGAYARMDAAGTCIVAVQARYAGRKEKP